MAAAVPLLLALAAGAWWWLRAPQAVLFADLAPQDAAVLAAELDQQKVPYAVGADGATLLVDERQVHAVRMKLMGKDLPLRGAVGFELFNGSDLGLTEFAQKVNFQRALQGELTRTILSFPEVREARVHLAMAEQGLFRQGVGRAKAAVTLATRHGQGLRPEQVLGIQRLVAASVPGLTPQEVTVVDRHGVALSRWPQEGEPWGEARMHLKREVENYLARKAAAVLDHVFGAGEVLASVDATLDMDQVRVTTEEVLGAGDARAGPVSGVLVRERESARDHAGVDARSPDARGGRGSSLQRDAEYQPGRRVEQLVGQPGSIRRLHVVAVLQRPMGRAEQETMRAVLAGAVGVVPERGDTVVVQSFQPPAADPAAAPAVVPARQQPEAPLVQEAPSGWLAGSAALAIPLVLLLVLRARRLRQARPTRLTGAQRQLVLRQVHDWLAEGDPASSRPAPPASR